MHDVGDVQQLAAERTARVQDLEILGREPLAFEQGDGKRIAERQHHGGRGRWRQAHGAGFGRPRQNQRDVGGFGKRAVRLRGHGDERNAETAGVENYVAQFRGIARIGHGHHGVGRGDHAQITMTRLAGMDELGRGPGGREGRGNLAPDVAGFAHARDRDAPTHRLQNVECADKSLVE